MARQDNGFVPRKVGSIRLVIRKIHGLSDLLPFLIFRRNHSSETDFLDFFGTWPEFVDLVSIGHLGYSERDSGGWSVGHGSPTDFEGANALAKRPRNLWRRPNSSFRLGEGKPVVGNLDEQRITLYLPVFVLDQAESQAMRAGVSTVQEYCTRLLRDAIEDVRRTEQAAEAEAKRNALVGYHAITEDPDYLVEWNASASPRDRGEIHIIEALDQPQQADAMPEGPSQSAQVVLRHAAVESDDPTGFLATIRRGEPVAQNSAEELLQAIHSLEAEYRDARMIDRRVAYALHRLAFEGQVLHTDAWPGALDEVTVSLLRTVQEAVDRVLSGEDIRYYPSGN